ncbi:phage tail protein I [Paenibacillus sp. NPDC058367]|uniref:phage tail protein I n=1 Tax=Paenibacillus sp. NPDC058367 TaxID=3346460 RepID=UPI003655B7EB
MSGNDDVQGMSSALSYQFQEIAAEIINVLIYSQIDKQPSEVLDILAWQFGADWYDSNAEIEIKRKAIKDVLYLARIRGTPEAVRRVIEIYFGDGRVEEWFDYGGEPGYFRVVTTNTAATSEQAERFAKAINSVKRLSAWLETIIIQSTDNMDIYTGVVLRMTDKLTLKQVT